MTGWTATTVTKRNVRIKARKGGRNQVKKVARKKSAKMSVNACNGNTKAETQYREEGGKLHRPD